MDLAVSKCRSPWGYIQSDIKGDLCIFSRIDERKEAGRDASPALNWHPNESNKGSFRPIGNVRDFWVCCVSPCMALLCFSAAAVSRFQRVSSTHLYARRYQYFSVSERECIGGSRAEIKCSDVSGTLYEQGRLSLSIRWSTMQALMEKLAVNRPRSTLVRRWHCNLCRCGNVMCGHWCIPYSSNRLRQGSHDITVRKCLLTEATSILSCCIYSCQSGDLFITWKPCLTIEILAHCKRNLPCR